MKRFFYLTKKVLSFMAIPYVYKIFFMLLLIYLGYSCFYFFQKWNIIPTHQIEANLSTEGLISDKSHCNLLLRINADNSFIEPNPLFDGNILFIKCNNNFTDTIAIKKLYNGKCRYVYYKRPNAFINKKTFYYLDYKVHSNIKSHVHNKNFAGVLKHNIHQMSYMEQPKLTSNSTGTTTTGSAILGFCSGGGDMTTLFYTSQLNKYPTVLSPWDITQAIYNVKFTCKKIKCNTISIDFIGATDFSSMDPIPDRITMSGVEFLDSTKISLIQTKGLRFHTEFLQLKEMSARRTFLLSAVLSLLVSVFANILFSKWKKQKG